MIIKRQRRHNTLAQLKVTAKEGGDWLPLNVHAVEMPDGRQWDCINGWRGPDPEIMEREEYIAVLEEKIAGLGII